MSGQQAPPGRPVIFGTAGHIDHGKTTLTRALTGQNTDRLPEEKARGISIDLGFAHFTLPNGQRVALIDVPGHERFVRHMVAGVHGMDAVLLVVAADEGVMPQTREHLDILQLLGVRHGLTVITKADLVEAELVDLVQEMVSESLAGSFLAEAPIVVVDGVSGRGMPALVTALGELARSAEDRPASGPVRLPIDRVFTVKGFGSVVTGTLVSGTIRTETPLEVVPSGELVRVRGIEVHGAKVRDAFAGQRVAVNLAGVDRSQMARGQVLATPGTLAGAEVVTVELDLLLSAPALDMNARVHCHIGTAEAVGRVYLYEGEEVQPGNRTYAELRLESVMPAARGDRFLVRSYSPVVTIGGGQVLEVGIRHRRREPGLLTRLARSAAASDTELALDILSTAKKPLTWADLSAAAGLDVGSLRQALAGQAQCLYDEERFLWWEPARKAWADNAAERVQAFQTAHPLLVGMPRERLRAELAENWPARAFAWVLEASPQLRLDREWVRREGYRPVPAPSVVETVRQVLESVERDGLRPETLETIRDRLQIPPDIFYDVLEHLTLAGEIVRLDDNYYISRRALDSGIARVRAVLAGQAELGTGELKEALDTNRRFAVLFLELLDGLHVTRRVGEKRVLQG
ncbi:MAG: selenocysteine-specific translation elongation factor [Thermaerobacter sp.]|nr:selenocysteine-specific translation elongation factor [Thermaerobacter sp.]